MFHEQINTQKSSVEAYSIPPDSQLGQVAVVGVAAPLSPRTPYPALALGFR